MKKLGMITLFSIASLTFVACNNEPKDSKELADSLNERSDSTNTADSIVAMSASERDAEFATSVAVFDIAGVEFSKLALSKATSGKVKDFANMMVNDHTATNDSLMAIAKSKNISLPIALDDKHQKDFAELNAKSGADFDKKYTDVMIDAHQKLENTLKDQNKNGMDTELNAFANKNLPIVQAHLETIKNIKKEL